MLYPAMRTLGGNFLVDIRGFWADERVDGGMIPRGGLVYRSLKTIERAMLRAADHIVTLTEASVPILRDDPAFGLPTAPISVIPTCADLTLFKPGEGAPRSGEFIFGYVGQIGSWYLVEEMIALFLAVKQRWPSAKMLFVNQHQHASILAALAKAGVSKDAFEVVRPAARKSRPKSAHDIRCRFDSAGLLKDIELSDQTRRISRLRCAVRRHPGWATSPDHRQ